MKRRIWELDAFRGICILGVIFVHFVFDATALYGLIDIQIPQWFHVLQQWGGILFVLLSGICATLGSHSFKRGMVVFGCGLLVTAVTCGMYLLKLAEIWIIIYFGVLHCLGVCMVLWGGLKRLPTWALAALGAVMAAVGLYLISRTFDNVPVWMMVLGVRATGLNTGDYFPLLPYLGFFLLGAVLGRTVYARKETLLPKVNAKNPVLRALTFCGRHSLWIYLGHQPLLAGLFTLLTMMK